MRPAESPLVDDYLRRLRAALAGLPADRRREIIEGLSQHIAEVDPWPAAVRALTVLGWLAGLGAIVLLWQRSSTAFIKARFR